MNTVSVVVVTHNSGHHLARLGVALAASRYPLERILVIDNASRDDTIKQAYENGFQVHETGGNLGFGAACNVALKEIATDLVLFCNPDVTPSPDALDRLVDELSSIPNAAVAGVAFDRPCYARRYSHVSSDLWSFLPGFLQRGLGRFANEVSVAPMQRHVIVDYVVGAFMLCRTSVIVALGGFDERFFLYSEEEDLCRRLAQSGWRTLFVPAVSVSHAHSTSSRGVDGAIMAPFRFHSLYRYYRKHHGRLYAECARAALAICVIADRNYRILTRREQAYGQGTAVAMFRGVDRVLARAEYAERWIDASATCDRNDAEAYAAAGTPFGRTAARGPFGGG
jgi:GT2 family glycosyltransferase